MFLKVLSSAVIASAVSASSALAGFYVGGGLNHIDDRHTTNKAQQSTSRSNPLAAIGLGLNGGYLGNFGNDDKNYYGVELFTNIGNTSFNLNTNTKIKSGYSLGLSGKVGHYFDEKTSVYGVLGVARSSTSTTSGGTTKVNFNSVVFGVGIENKLCKNTSVFAQFDYYNPIKTSTVGDTLIRSPKAVSQLGVKYYF